MDGYIIDPKWFYWINILPKVEHVLFAIIILCVAGAMMSYFGYCDAYGDDEKRFLNLVKKFAVTCVIATIAVVFIPSKEALIQMKIAEFATYENANWTVETIKAATDYIIDGMKSIKGN